MNEFKKYDTYVYVYIYVHCGVLLSIKEELNYTFWNKWMELEDIVLSKVSQIQKGKGYVFSSTDIEDKSKR
jgi:hypothetical protein